MAMTRLFPGRSSYWENKLENTWVRQTREGLQYQMRVLGISKSPTDYP